MDECADGVPSESGDYRRTMENVHGMVDISGAGASSKGSQLHQSVQIADECTALGNDDNSYLQKASATDMNVPHDEDMSGRFIPNAPFDMKPIVGTEFTSLDDVFNFYNRYAWVCGFSVRKDTTRRNKTGEISMRFFRCSKAGARNKNFIHLQPQKRRRSPLTRSCCPARIVVKLCGIGNVYQVTQFEEAHSHMLCTPRKTIRLRSHKKLTDDHLNLITSLNRSGVGVVRCIDFMRAEVGGPSQLGFSERDVRNALTRRRQKMFGSDADALLRYFRTKQKEDHEFSYDIVVDEDTRLQSCFWVDRKSKEDYMVFSDVICFDTTYKTNEYDMPFGPFVDVNHHMQTVLLGAGLLFGETIDDFKWLFQSWLDAMGGVQPKTIITDQDPAMKQAIASIFPQAHHLLCLWHINKKLPDKFSHVLHEHPTFKATWDHCLYSSSSIEEYESRWSSMIAEFDLHSHSWLRHMYQIRHMWVPAYTRGIFTAGMRTTARSESMNAFFDGFVHHKANLMRFVDGYDKAIAKQREDEARADYDNFKGKPMLKTKCGLESAMAAIYTLKVFLLFQQDMEDSMYYTGNVCASNGETEEWHVVSYNKPGEPKGKMVCWNERDMVASCACMKFESSGMLCKHIITIFRLKRIMTMPSKHLLPRWTRTAKTRFNQHTEITSVSGTQSTLLRGFILSRHWLSLRSEAIQNLAAFEIVNKYMNIASAEISQLPKDDVIHNAVIEDVQMEDRVDGEAGDNFMFDASEDNMGVGILQGGSSGTLPTQSSQACIHLSDPIRIQHKGRSSSRIKGHLELRVAGGRKCHGCQQYGHDKRTCPHINGPATVGRTEAINDGNSSRFRGRGRRGGAK